MPFLTDVQELKTGLIIFRRSDVEHHNWYCRVRVPGEPTNRYKTISLKTPNDREAKDKAFEHDADIRFRKKHGIPVFEKTFAEVALEYSAHHRRMAEAGQITMERWVVVDGYIRLHLIPYAGHLQIVHVRETHWKDYPHWRKNNNAPEKPKAYGGRRLRANGKAAAVSGQAGEKKKHVPAADGTVRQEMATFRAIMNFAADKEYIRENQVPKGRLPSDEARREPFTPQEYRRLHTDARNKWLGKGDTERNNWYRQMTYLFMLVMTNTGMRTIEARNLKWRNVDFREDKHGRRFVALMVRGKKKHRELVAAGGVAGYFERIKQISPVRGPDDVPAPKPDDFVFCKYDGEHCADNYGLHVEDLLTTTGLLHSDTGSRRSAYSFRHTYATFRIMEGVDVYVLSKQMGTSVKMIEDHYGHITPVENAGLILQGTPGWEPVAEMPDGKPEA